MTPKSQKTNEKLVGLEGFEPPTHGLGNENVPYPLFGMSQLASRLKVVLRYSEASMHQFMHQQDPLPLA